MVSTIDGSVTDAEGLSGGISSEADRRVFRVLRSLADAIVVGARTAEVERYRRAAVPVVLLTRSLALDLTTPLAPARRPGLGRGARHRPRRCASATGVSRCSQHAARVGGIELLTAGDVGPRPRRGRCDAAARAGPRAPALRGRTRPCSPRWWRRTWSTSCASRRRRTSSAVRPDASCTARMHSAPDRLGARRALRGRAAFSSPAGTAPADPAEGDVPRDDTPACRRRFVTLSGGQRGARRATAMAQITKGTWSGSRA